MDEGQLLLLWPGEVRRKREDDSGQTGPALFAGSNKTELGIFFLLMPHYQVKKLIKDALRPRQLP